MGRPLTPDDVRWIILHTTAGSDDATIEDIRAAHLARGFSDIGYHFLVWRDGTVKAGRPIDTQGAHVRGWNDESLSVALVGHGDLERPSDEQWAAAAELVATLAHTYKVPWDQVLGHRETYDRDGQRRLKTCPGTKVDMAAFRWDVGRRMHRMGHDLPMVSRD